MSTCTCGHEEIYHALRKFNMPPSGVLTVCLVNGCFCERYMRDTSEQECVFCGHSKRSHTTSSSTTCRACLVDEILSSNSKYCKKFIPMYSVNKPYLLVMRNR